jgi:hypothetical protein
MASPIAPARPAVADASGQARAAYQALQAATARARSTDATGGRQHMADQAAARVAQQQYQAAQQRLAAARSAPSSSVAAPPSATASPGMPMVGVTHHDTPGPKGTGSIADYLQDHPSAATDMGRIQRPAIPSKGLLDQTSANFVQSQGIAPPSSIAQPPAPVEARPPTATIGGDSSAAPSAGATGGDRPAVAEQARVSGDFLRRIEFNTRPIQLNQTQTASIF